MTAIISLLIIISISVLITRIGTIAFLHTGLSKEVAKFQARSAYLGVGFTTQESELMVKDPVRRKILTLLIFTGNAGIITTISSVVFSFISLQETGIISIEMLILTGGIALLIFLAYSDFVDRKLSRFIEKLLKKYTYLDVKDYYSLLNLESDYRVSELKVEEGDWVYEKSLKELQLDKEGVLVLGIKRANGDYLGAPYGKTKIEIDDIIILYGEKSDLQSLEDRKTGSGGDEEHKDAVDKQNKKKDEQDDE
ncbi:MAG TPA: TrkA C-terminal domain-containing protein [Salegentibacter sp.]|nr:TrkA C-terminal domain-containing protein [Salegentibacter sp.]